MSKLNSLFFYICLFCDDKIYSVNSSTHYYLQSLCYSLDLQIFTLLLKVGSLWTTPINQFLPSFSLWKPTFMSSNFLDATCKWDPAVFVILRLILLGITPSGSICVDENGKISCFKSLSNIPGIYTPHLLHLFIFWWSLRLLQYLGYRK